MRELRTRVHNALKRATHFQQAEDGMVAPMFGLTIIMLMAMVGMAVDYGRASVMHYRLQQMADTVAIQAARELQKTGKTDVAYTRAAAHLRGLLSENGVAGNDVDIVEGSLPSGPPASGGTRAGVVVNGDTGEVQVAVAHSADTPFMSIAGKDGIDIGVDAMASTSTKELDMALMFDLTGSMGSADNTISQAEGGDGTKLGAARVAAKDMLDIVMPNGATPRVRMSIVPFSQYVSVSRSEAAELTGLPETRERSRQVTRQREVEREVCENWKIKDNFSYSCRYYWWYKSYCYRIEERCETRTVTENYQDTEYYTEYLKTCMSEREGNSEYTDDMPSAGFQNPGYTEDENFECQLPTASVQPLTSTKQTLIDKINSFTQPQGGTAGHLGTAFSWYSISPNFNSVWEDGVDAAAYTDEKVLKAVVLLTDGAYTMHNSKGNCNGGDYCYEARTDARAICEAMKDKEVMVFAVGFGITNAQTAAVNPYTLPEWDSRRVLADCAGEGRYFFPYNGEQLRQAFKAIGAALSEIQGEVVLNN